MNEQTIQSVLVTGATGFLGSELVNQATRAGLRVRATGLRSTSSFNGADYYCANILETPSLIPVIDKIDCVIHAAGLAHIFDNAKAAAAPFGAVNVQGTANVARAAAEAGVRHFVLVSSVAVYGGSRPGGTNEDSACHPKNPYAESKFQAEKRALDIAKESQMSLTILRLATLYGEGDPGNVFRLMDAIAQDRFVWIGSGANHKSLLHREDAARACLAVVQEPAQGINVYNVSAPPCTMSEVVTGLTDGLEKRVWPVRVPAWMAIGLTRLGVALWPRPLESIYSSVEKWLADDVYDASKFGNTFDFRTEITLADGLRREADWYRKTARRRWQS